MTLSNHYDHIKIVIGRIEEILKQEFPYTTVFGTRLRHTKNGIRYLLTLNVGSKKINVVIDETN